MSSQPIDHDEHRGSGVPAVLERLRGEVRELGQTLWAARGRDELMDGVAAIETLKATLESVELAMVRELDATHAVKAAGWASTQDFVTSVAGGHKGTGPAAVRLSAALETPLLAPVAEALRDGWLSATKAHVIERAVDTLPGDPDLRARAVSFLLDQAKALDATELRMLTHRLLSIVDPDGDDRRAERELDRLERAAHLGRHLTITEDQCGGAWIKGRCSSEDAALIKATLIPLAAPQPAAHPGGRAASAASGQSRPCDPATCQIPGCGHDGRDPRDHGTRMLDALVEGCRRLQTADLLPTSHGAVPRLTLMMSLTELQQRAGVAITETGEQLSASAVRLLCCDAEVIPAVLGGRSEVLDVGRLHRLVTPAIWKALVARDQHCRFPHCTRPPLMCHAHHLEHWIKGGPTSLENLILVCGHHHRLIHAAPWTIRRTGPADFAFDPPPGVRRRVPGARPPPPDD